MHELQDVFVFHDFANGVEGDHDSPVILVDARGKAGPNVDAVTLDFSRGLVIEIVAADLNETGGALCVAEDAVEDLLHRR